jgi:hypothetical protein
MAQRKPEEKPTIEQVLRLVDRLTSEEQERLRAKLNSKSKTDRWDALYSKVQAQSKDLPRISDEEITADLKEIRQELKAERACQSDT